VYHWKVGTFSILFLHQITIKVTFLLHPHPRLYLCIDRAAKLLECALASLQMTVGFDHAAIAEALSHRLPSLHASPAASELADTLQTLLRNPYCTLRRMLATLGWAHT
jgi:hypothetical protein